VSTFRELGVPAELSDSLASRGITEPFPIQAATLPDSLAGRDVCGRAPTGSGKTLAFGLAIAARKEVADPRRPWGLVLVPTRELAAQVRDELSQLLAPFRATAVAIYGGTGYEYQRRALNKGVDVVVACPGRLEDLLANGDLTLDAVSVAVLDEADRMADMGFVPAVRRILDQTPHDRQVLLFSATLDGDVDKVIRDYLRTPARHDVVGVDEPGDVTHRFWKVAHVDRVRITASIVKEHGRSIVFSRTKHGADRIARQLGTLGITAVALHGDRTQAQRDRALAAFADGRAVALVATDVAARGIHVDQVNCVVHFDPPADHKDYVHRSGRTGRAGATGHVITLVIPEKRKDVAALQRALQVSVPLDDAGVPLAEPTAVRAEVAPAPARPKAQKARNAPPRPHGPKGRHDRHGPRGTVKFYDARKGYGFIVDGRGKDVFVHVTAVHASGLRILEPGQQVAFDLEPGRKGQEAHRLRVLG
jgi:superfamily II DNA/RNA helicase